MKISHQTIKLTSRAALIVFVLMALPTMHLFAQPGGMGGSPGGAPIDGGLSLLVAAGIGYGIKKAYAARKKATPGQNKQQQS